MLKICLPLRDQVYTDFMFSLLALTNRLVKKQIPFSIEQYRSSVIAESRQQLLYNSFDCDEILWLDSDMVFPETIYEDLKKHNKDIIACAYNNRYPPHKPNVFVDDSFNEIQANSGVHKVYAVGMGAMLTKVSAIRKLSKPYFGHTYLQDLNHIAGEDIYFCQNCNNNNISIYVDLDCKIGHIGTKIY